MTESKTFTIELTLDEISALVGAAYAHEGKGSEAMRAAAMSIIEQQLKASKQQ
jgi:hypothetical protein